MESRWLSEERGGDGEGGGQLSELKAARESYFMKNQLPLGLLLAGLVTGAVLASAAPLKFQMPLETAKFKPAPGVELATANCLLCHSAEYVATQPRLPRAFWAANLKKMREKYGAPIQPAQVDPLLDYLVANYGKQ